MATATAVLHDHPAEITEMVVLVVVVVVAETTALIITAEMTGTAAVLLPEPEEKAEEAVTRRGTRGTLLLRPNVAAPRPGHAGLPLPPRQ
jgi:hypothetical protein